MGTLPSPFADNSTGSKAWDYLGPGAAYGIGAGLSGVGAGLGGMFAGGKNPADAAKGYLDKIPEALRPYFEPYMNAGKGALGNVQSQYESLIKNPNEIMGKIGAGYQESPGFQFQKNQALTGINNAAGAGGMLGSPMHQQQAGEMSSNLANKDYWDYMSKALGMYGTGLAGEQGISTAGQQSSQDFGTMLAQALQNQGNLAYTGQANKNEQQGNNWGNIIGGAASILPYLLM